MLNVNPPLVDLSGENLNLTGPHSDLAGLLVGGHFFTSEPIVSAPLTMLKGPYWSSAGMDLLDANLRVARLGADPPDADSERSGAHSDMSPQHLGGGVQP